MRRELTEESVSRQRTAACAKTPQARGNRLVEPKGQCAWSRDEVRVSQGSRPLKG